MPALKRKFLLVTPSETNVLDIIRDFIAKIARNMGFVEEYVHKIQLSVDEACTNVIKHGYKGMSKKDIKIQVETDNIKFIVTVIDRGKGFKPHLAKPDDIKKYINEYRRGGLGLHLIYILMDEVKISSTANNGSKIIMTKYLNRKESKEKKSQQKFLLEKSYARVK